MDRRVWLEVALNGPWTRRGQPGIPITVGELVSEGIACARAGAAIVHIHAYDPDTERQNDDPAMYAAVIQGIRASTDVIVYPTVPVSLPTGWRSRYEGAETLAKRGLLEWCVVDPGSVNLSRFDSVKADRVGIPYVNSEGEIRQGLALSATHGFHPTYACYEPGFVRLGAALRRQYRQAPRPLYRFMFSDEFAFGLPPDRWALEMYVRLLSREAGPDAPWMIAGLGVDILPLIPAAVELGGHVRVGLEDAPHGSQRTNRELVEAAVKEIQAAGASLATPAEVREAFKAGQSRTGSA